MEDSQQETFASYPLLVVGGHEAYMSGEEGARFYPDRAMTRAEMAQVLYNLLASYPPVTGGSFSDVSDSAWYATAVNTLVELDVLSGYEDGTFRPNNARHPGGVRHRRVPSALTASPPAARAFPTCPATGRRALSTRPWPRIGSAAFPTAPSGRTRASSAAR